MEKTKNFPVSKVLLGVGLVGLFGYCLLNLVGDPVGLLIVLGVVVLAVAAMMCCSENEKR